jgi:hypothetical protein
MWTGDIPPELLYRLITAGTQEYYKKDLDLY